MKDQAMLGNLPGGSGDVCLNSIEVAAKLFF
jgi:hypothetical protein